MAKNNLSSAFGRCWISFSNGACPQEYEYYGDLRVDAIQRSSGAVTPILKGRQVAASLRAVPGPWAGSATGRIQGQDKSRLKDAYDRGVPVNIQIHYGLCNSPTDFTDYEDVLLMERVYVTDYTTTPLTATQPSEVVLLQETFALVFERTDWLHQPALAQSDDGATTVAAIESLALVDTDNCSFCTPYRRIYAWTQALYTGVVPYATVNYSLAWSDDGGVTWGTTSIADATYITAKRAQSSRIVCLGDLIVGFNHYNIFIVDAHNLVDGGSTQVYFPYTFTDGIHEAVDILRYGNQVYVLFAGGTIVAVNRDKSTELVMETGISAADSFCMLSNGHAMVGQSFYGVNGNAVFECYGGTNRLVSNGIENGFYITNLTSTPTDYVFLSTTSGSMYGKSAESDTFSLVFTALGNNCVSQMVFATESIGYLTANLVYRTIDGGVTWEIINDYPWEANSYVMIALAVDGDKAYAGGMNDDGVLNPCTAYNYRTGASAGIVAYTI